ncbi:hypothetical protein D3C84_933360 [compost metagenome]
MTVSFWSICGVTSREMPEKNGVRVISGVGGMATPSTIVPLLELSPDDTSVTKKRSSPTLITAF